MKRIDLSRWDPPRVFLVLSVLIWLAFAAFGAPWLAPAEIGPEPPVPESHP